MRGVMNAANGMSRIERCDGATMYAPVGGTCSLPTTRTRNTTLNALSTTARGELVEGHANTCSARATIPAMTSAAVTSLVSITTASGAASSGRVARPRVESAWSRRCERVAHVVDRDRARRGHLVALAPRGADVVPRGEEDLQRRVGEHDGADVAALDDAPAVLAYPRALALDQHRADRRVRRHLRHRRGDLGAADLGRDVAPVEPHADRRRARSGGAGDRGDRVAVVEVDAGVERGERDRAVHRAGVERREPEGVGDAARDRRLPRAGGPVDGDRPGHVPSERGPAGDRGEILR